MALCNSFRVGNMPKEVPALIDPVNPSEFHAAVSKLRAFFEGRGFVEVPVQHRLSILAACEDPKTIGLFMYMGDTWPLPQTGQMWLERELLTKPEAPGYFCVSYSYREEPDPKPGRHNLIFPMFEFETHGDMERLIKEEQDLVLHLGFSPLHVRMLYDAAARHCGVNELKAEHEERLGQDFGPVFFLTDFPQVTSPFWNMKKEGDYAKKVDVLLYGVETIGSAERSTNPDEMRHLFHTISNGMYAQILFSKFRKERVLAELEDFLSLPFFPRCGGGIGMTRLIRAMKLAGNLFI